MRRTNDESSTNSYRNDAVAQNPPRTVAALQLFAQNLVETKAFPKELAKKIGKLASLRARADYEPIFTQREEAEEAIRISEEVLGKTKEILTPST